MYLMYVICDDSFFWFGPKCIQIFCWRHYQVGWRSICGWLPPNLFSLSPTRINSLFAEGEISIELTDTAHTHRGLAKEGPSNSVDGFISSSRASCPAKGGLGAAEGEAFSSPPGPMGGIRNEADLRRKLLFDFFPERIKIRKKKRENRWTTKCHAMHT